MTRADGKARLEQAGYWTGASGANGQPRCERCQACERPADAFGKSKYDRFCILNNAAVKTHGCCRRFIAIAA